MERRKLFGESVQRRNLFSDSKPRRSLFSAKGNNYKCKDCEKEFSVPSKYCPNCGGNRVVCCETPGGRRKLFSGESEKDFSDTYDATDEFLKEFSEKSLSVSDLTRYFSERGINSSAEEMINSGYARLQEDGQICFSERPDIQRKLFSKLVISVTKELELVPVDSKEALIHDLTERGNLPTRCITLIKKAHGLPGESCCCGHEGYLEDSGLKNDLKLQYGTQEMPLSEFLGILKKQYNDAPDDIIDRLVAEDVINISGNCVKIN